MADELPPLPQAVDVTPHTWSNLYSADQMRAYAQEAARQEREACAKLCEDRAKDYWGFTEEEFAFEAAAAAIRARSPSTPVQETP